MTDQPRPPYVRLSPASLPPIFKLPSSDLYTQLSLTTCQLSKLPAMRDGDGHLKGPAATSAERYDFPADLGLDEVDENADLGDGGAEVEAAGNWKKGATPCASIRLGSNHLKLLDRRVFEGVPFLASLDLSTNHISRLELAPESVSRLCVLSLRSRWGHTA